MDTDVTKNHSEIGLIEGEDDNKISESTENVNRSTSQKRVLTPKEIAKTFRIMAYRKSERQVRGRYRRRSLTRVFWFIMFMMLFLSLMGAGIGGQLANVSAWNRWPEFATLVAIFVVMMYVYYKITEVVRWCFYWLAIATLILLIINRGSIVNDKNMSFASSYASRLVLIILGGVEALTLIIWVLVRFGYPRIVKNADCLDTIWWWCIKQLDTKGIDGEIVGCFRYFAWESYSMWFRHGTIKYVGEVDENGYPHGLGEWIDDSFDGECLKGVWEHGEPTGPFHSRGSGTGDAFHSVRVGLVKNRDTPWDEWRPYPRPYQNGIEALVASVECSVSGKYFKHLPRAHIILPPKSQDSHEEDIESYISPIEYCLGHMRTFASAMGPDLTVNENSTVIIRLTNKGLAITGYYPINPTTSRDEVIVRRVPIKDRLNSSKTKYAIEIDEWLPSEGISPYSLTHSTDHTIRRSSQECIIFIHGFNCPSKFAIETLGQFLALADLPDYIKPFVFSPPGANSLWYFGSKKLGSSEEAMNDFRTFLQNLCDSGFGNVHIISHSMGCMLAIKYLDVFEGLFHTIGSSLDITSHKDKNGLLKLKTFTLLNPDTSYKSFIEQDYVKLSNYCDHITIYSNGRDFALKIGEILRGEKSLGRQTDDLKFNNNLLNVDLIDTTQLDVNIHKMRHNFFNLNRLLVDDLSDIIILGKRARERQTRLSRKGVGREGVVYTFLVAPSYVVNK
ncbi:hypothetical protein C2G38_2053776 [Gigaspora rosea]|uniref:Alpha/Beta hydrolase protein n=1 Tax=Gigaspora rosea TaxID=44941 RepID=A0A397W6S9_9GLOM|nr:hypothetical protein C2G38_2053776 [Gigaspora rosea]